MTIHPIDTEALRREALGQLGQVAADPRWPGRVLSLLDALADAEHRATRAEERIAEEKALRMKAVAAVTEAEARIEAVRDVLDNIDTSNDPALHDGFADILRALDGDA